MKKYPAYGKIRIENKRAICPRCGAKLPGEYYTGCVVKGMAIQCKHCRTKIRIHIDNSDQRPKASSVQ